MIILLYSDADPFHLVEILRHKYSLNMDEKSLNNESTFPDGAAMYASNFKVKYLGSVGRS